MEIDPTCVDRGIYGNSRYRVYLILVAVIDYTFVLLRAGPRSVTTEWWCGVIFAERGGIGGE